jgi:flavoprotein
MDSFTMLHSTLGLNGLTCGLSHGSWNEGVECAAVDYLVIPCGFQVGEIEYRLNDYKYIPVCKDCAETIQDQDPDWNLFMCLGCGYCEWHIRKVAKYYSDNFIIYTDQCKFCRGEI